MRWIICALWVAWTLASPPAGAEDHFFVRSWDLEATVPSASLAYDPARADPFLVRGSFSGMAGVNLRTHDPSGTPVASFSWVGPGTARNGIAVDWQGSGYLALSATSPAVEADQVVQVDAAWTAGALAFSLPGPSIELTTDPANGDVFVLGHLTNTVHRFDAAGTPLGTFTPDFLPMLTLRGLGFDGVRGHVLVAHAQLDTHPVVYGYTPDGTQAASHDLLGAPAGIRADGIAFDPVRRLIYLQGDNPENRVYVFEAASNAVFADGFESGDLSGWTLVEP